MNDEHDLRSRLVDYHDHISAPSVPVADDLRRGRRRVRRNRGVVAGGVAVGIVSVIAAVMLSSGERSDDRPQPAGPPGLITPLALPETPLDVRQLGFHVEATPDITPNQDWSLAPSHQATTVDWAGHSLFVRVYYSGTGRPPWQLNVEDGHVQPVRVHGVPGVYTEQFGRANAADEIEFGAEACSVPSRACHIWQSELIWEFAPGSWATVYGVSGESPPPQASIRPAFLEVAEALRSGGGASTRVPFRVGTGPGPLPSLTEAGVGLKAVDHPPGTSGWGISFYGEPTLEFSVGVLSCMPDAETTVQPFTYRRHQGCLHFYEGELSAVFLRVGGVNRGISNFLRADDRMAVADLKQWLADLTVAPLDDPSQWFELESAFPED